MEQDKMAHDNRSPAKAGDRSGKQARPAHGKRRSIALELFVVFISLLLLILVVMLCMNHAYLTRFYEMRLQFTLKNAYHEVDSHVSAESGVDQDYFENEFRTLERSGNISLVISDPEFESVIEVSREDDKVMAARLNAYSMGLDQMDCIILEQKDRYVIQKKPDGKYQMDFLEMWGVLPSSGYHFMMRIPMDSIRMSAKISNEFILYTVLLTGLMGIFLIGWLSRRIARPVKELTRLSERMASLDFDAKYTSGGKNEIGQLGENFNQMSEALEKAISELKTANNELQKNLDEKTKIDDMRREFLSNVSHELKTPLALIQGYAEGLQDSVYYSPIQVAISCPTSGAKIYYTTNGSDPTTSSTEYTAPFTLNSNTTVKAISALDGEVSEVVSAAYEFGTATQVDNIAAYQNVADGTVVMFKNPVNVLAQSQNKRYLYVKDNSGYTLIYSDCGQTYVNGDVIPAGFVGTKKTYNGEPELADPLSGFQPASSNSPIAPTTPFTANQVSHATFANYVSMDEVTFTKDGNNYILTDASGNTCAVYFGTMGVSAPSDLNAKYDVIGVVGSYGSDNTVYQLLPTYVKKHTNPGEGFGFGSMFDTPDNEVVTFENDATVIWQGGNNNNYLYAFDSTGFGLVYGNVSNTYHFGDIIPAGFGGKKTTYKGEPELAAIENGQPLPGFQPASGKVTPTPEVITPAEVNHEHWAHYVLLKNVMINPEGTIITQNGVTCEMYNKTFNIPMPEDLSVPHDVYGIVGVFNNYQVLPISFDQAPGEYVEPDPVDVANINELYALNANEKGHFTTPLTTIYQYGPNLYVKDVDGNYSLAYGSVAYTEFVNGDFINDAVATWTTYQNNNQMVPVADTFVKAGHGTAVDPEIMPIEEVSQDMVHWYLGFENASITREGEDMFVTDETGSIKLFDKFNIITEDVDLDAVEYVEGFLTVYKGELELYPISFGNEIPDCGKKGDVNNDGEVNIADINALIDIILTGKPVDDCTFWRADVAEDNELGIADINALISGILSGTM